MTSINTSCAQVVQELRKKGKKVYSIGDVTNALIEQGPGRI
jgi:soluble P-type ATPase